MPTHREMGFEFTEPDGDIIIIDFWKQQQAVSLSTENARNLSEALLALIRTRVEPMVQGPSNDPVNWKAIHRYRVALWSLSENARELDDGDIITCLMEYCATIAKRKGVTNAKAFAAVARNSFDVVLEDEQY